MQDHAELTGMGEVIRPDDAEYDGARLVWNRAVDHFPAAIVRVAGAEDVARAIAFARERSLPLAVRSGGHGIAGHGGGDGGLVIDLSRLRGLTIDAERRVARAQPGLTLSEYAQQAQAYGLATSSGDTPSVGVGGLTLGGGTGFMARRYGLTIDSLLAVDLVTADGSLVHASADQHPDLFWALRGGGGNFGVATVFDFRLQPAGTVLGGSLIFEASREVVRGWLERAAQAPDALTTIGSILEAPPLPFIPSALHGRVILIVNICCVGEGESAQRAVAPLRTIGTPVADSTGPTPYAEVIEGGRQVSQPKPYALRSGYLRTLGDTDAILDAILDGAARMLAPFGRIELRVLGGAVARVPELATAFAHRDRPFMVSVIGSCLDLADVERQRAWMEQLWAEVRPRTDGVSPNFLDDEGPQRVREAYSPALWERLTEIKRRYDPGNLFRANHNIPPADQKVQQP